MKNKKILGITTACVLCTSSIVFASDLKLLKKENTEYVPLKKMIQKSGGKVEESKDLTKINIKGSNISIDKDSSFAKIDDEYYPLNEKKINGFNVPVDTKPLYEGKEIYIAKNFLKDNKIVEYKIDGDKIVITTEKPVVSSNTDKKEENKEKPETNNTNNDSEKPEVTRPTTPETNRPTRPSRPSTGGNNSNNNSNSGNNNNSNNNSNSGNNNNNNNNSNSGNHNSGNTGGNNGEDTGTDSGNNGNESGNTGGDTGTDSGNTGDNGSSGNDNNSGSTDGSGDDSSQPPETTAPQAIEN